MYLLIIQNYILVINLKSLIYFDGYWINYYILVFLNW